MREPQVIEKPNYYPYVCIKCGTNGISPDGTPQREYFLELGIDLVQYFNPYQEGNIYLCSFCWNEVQRLVQQKVDVYTGVGQMVQPPVGMPYYEESKGKGKELDSDGQSGILDEPSNFTTGIDQELTTDSYESERSDLVFDELLPTDNEDSDDSSGSELSEFRASFGA